MKKNIILSCALSLGLFGCATAELEYSNNYDDVIDFSKSMVVDLSAGADKLLSMQHNRTNDEGDYIEYKGKFFPRSGYYGVINSYMNFCDGIGGSYLDSKCISSEDSKQVLFVALVKATNEVTSIECASGDTLFGKSNCGLNRNLNAIQPAHENFDTRVWLTVYAPKGDYNASGYQNVIKSIE